MRKLMYIVSHKRLTVRVFKLDVDELRQDAYEIESTNDKTGETESVTTNTPQGAIALADYVFAGL